MTCDSAKVSPRLLDSNSFPGGSGNSSYLEFLLFSSHNMVYDRRRDEPVLPATTPLTQFYNHSSRVLEHYDGPGIKDGSHLFINLDSRPTVLGCVHSTFICSADRGGCWNYPDAPVSHLENFDPLNISSHPGVLSNVNGATDAELAHVLLSNALWETWGSITCPRFMHTAFTTTIMDSCVVSYNSEFQLDSCNNFRLDQWKDEVRRMFEISLAQIQFNVLAIVKGDGGLSKSPYSQGLPPHLRGICRMGKFKSVGCRNVSVWGLFGLLFFAASVFLASIKTEKDELWLIIWARFLKRAILGAFEKARTIPWKFMYNYVYFRVGHPRQLVRFLG